MFIARGIQQLNQHLNKLNVKEKSVGFVPTMGALHAGHLELVKSSIKDNEITICSIFVNPTQFNDKSDFDKYPRNDYDDIALLKDTGLAVIYFPNADELYPKNKAELFDYDDEKLFSVFEGEFRPGHFLGVTTVVMRLFEHIKPNNAYFGLKDYQQYLVIKRATPHFFRNLNIIGVPTVRNESGLALSSRNARLSKPELINAEAIVGSLRSFSQNKRKLPIGTIVKNGMTAMKEKGLEPEYLVVCNADTLQEISNWDEADNYVALCAAFIGGVRLIDNLLF